VSLEGELQDVNTGLGTFPDLFHNPFNVVRFLTVNENKLELTSVSVKNMETFKYAWEEHQGML